jgi:hypothetical protein
MALGNARLREPRLQRPRVRAYEILDLTAHF